MLEVLLVFNSRHHCEYPGVPAQSHVSDAGRDTQVVDHQWHECVRACWLLSSVPEALRSRSSQRTHRRFDGRGSSPKNHAVPADSRNCQAHSAYTKNGNARGPGTARTSLPSPTEPVRPLIVLPKAFQLWAEPGRSAT